MKKKVAHKKSAAKKSSAKKSAKKTAARRRYPRSTVTVTVSKAAFIRACDRGLSAKSVVELGKKKGLDISPAYVYATRYESAGRGRKNESKALGKPSSPDIGDLRNKVRIFADEFVSNVIRSLANASMDDLSSMLQ